MPGLSMITVGTKVHRETNTGARIRVEKKFNDGPFGGFKLIYVSDGIFTVPENLTHEDSPVRPMTQEEKNYIRNGAAESGVSIEIR